MRVPLPISIDLSSVSNCGGGTLVRAASTWNASTLGRSDGLRKASRRVQDAAGGRQREEGVLGERVSSLEAGSENGLCQKVSDKLNTGRDPEAS